MSYKKVINLLLTKDTNTNLKSKKKLLHILHHAAMHDMINLIRHCLNKNFNLNMIMIDALKYEIAEKTKKIMLLLLICIKNQTKLIKFLLNL